MFIAYRHQEAIIKKWLSIINQNYNLLGKWIKDDTKRKNKYSLYSNRNELMKLDFVILDREYHSKEEFHFYFDWMNI
jgi:hypothetical protein